MHLVFDAARGLSAVCCALAAVLSALACLAGCLPDIIGGNSDPSEQVLGYDPGSPSEQTAGESSYSFGQTITDTSQPFGEIISFDANAPTTHVEVEPNSDWNQVESLPFGGRIELIGNIAAATKDVDLFDIGPAHSGQRLQIDLTNNGADIQLAALDESGHCVAYLDPISPTAGPGRVDVVLHAPAEQLYVMLATRSISQTPRAYKAVVELSSVTIPPTWRPQAVVLVFNGANQVRIGSRPPVDVPPFDIAGINPEFAGRTEAAIELLMQNVSDDYAGLNVSFYRDTDPNRPTQGHTSIYFGTSDTRLLGLADNIDPYNANVRQSAILYTDTFSLFNQLNPGFNGTVGVLANVTSHEVGHLLGLRHTADPNDLMDVTASARQMLADQYFKVANLHSSVLPLGVQDAPTMLKWGVGGELNARFRPESHMLSKPVAPGGPDDFYIPRSMLMDCGCTECELDADQ